VFFCVLPEHNSSILIVLDPRIGYNSLYEDYRDEPDILANVQKCKALLEDHYMAHYTNYASIASSSPSDNTTNPSITIESSRPASPEKINFITRYTRRPVLSTKNELEEYLHQQPEEWGSCDPVKWWGARKYQFPNLSRLARDIMTIPGKLY
jgi:hypothetical protein